MQQLATLTVLLMSASLAPAQLSGSYTISPSGSGSRNFTSFGAAASALATGGVNGPVEFVVVFGTITESWTIPPVKGASAKNRVTFRGTVLPPNKYLTHLNGGANHVITLAAGVHDIVIDGFDFVSTKTGHAILAIANTASKLPISNIEIRNCRFGPGIAGDSSGKGHIQVEGKNISADWTIRGCEFNFKNYGYGIHINSVQGSRILRNKFNLNGTGIGLYRGGRGSDNVICNNQFSGTIRGLAVIMATAGDVCFNTFDVTIPTNRTAVLASGANTHIDRIYGNIFSVKGGGVAIAIWTTFLPDVQSDRNLFFVQGGGIGRIGNTVLTSLAAWQKATASTTRYGAQDLNSVVGDPKFVSTTDRHLKASSPALHKGVAFAGRYPALEDYDGFIRGSKRDIGAYELTAYRLYGTGCAGTGSKVPTIEIGGNIAPGEKVSIDLARARAGAPAVLSVGVTRTTIPLGSGCALLQIPILLIFIQTQSSGSASLPVAIPSSMSIQGVEGLLQFGVTDPAASGGIALSPGAAIRI